MMFNSLVLAQSGSSGGGMVTGLITLVIQLAIIGATLVGFWKTFEKMGRKGWEGIVPFYNVYILLQIFGRPVWWLVLFIIPFVNLIALIIVSVDVAKAFGKSVAFGVGLGLLAPIFYCILGFGPAKFTQPTGPAGFPAFR